MSRNTRWLVVLGVMALAFSLFMGTAWAQTEEPAQSDDTDTGWNMHAQMDPEMYGRMIQHMTEVHGAEFTAEMLQRMNEGGTCHDDGTMGPGMMGGGMMGRGMMGGGMHGDMMGGWDQTSTDTGFGPMMESMMQGIQGMMRGAGRMMGGGMMGH